MTNSIKQPPTLHEIALWNLQDILEDFFLIEEEKVDKGIQESTNNQPRKNVSLHPENRFYRFIRYEKSK